MLSKTGLTANYDWRCQETATAEGDSGVVFGVDVEFPDARDEGGTVDAHTSGGAIRATDAALAFGKGADDLFTLISRVLVGSILVSVQRMKGFFHDPRDVWLRFRRLVFGLCVGLRLAQLCQRRLERPASR